MNTIFRKVLPKERLPIQTGRYHTNRGLTNYFHEELKYPPKGFEYNIDYWLEEIELPTDEELKEKAKEISEGIYDDIAFRRVASDTIRYTSKWLIDFVLDITPNGVKK